MMNDKIYEILHKVAKKYDLQLECSYNLKSNDVTYSIVEERHMVSNYFVEKTKINKFYIDMMSDHIRIVMYSGRTRLCFMHVYDEEKINDIFKKIELCLETCYNFTNFLYGFVDCLR
jgi:hypothetical protein